MSDGEDYINNLVDELVNSVEKTTVKDGDEKEAIDGGSTELYKYPSLDGHKTFMLTMWVPKEFVGKIIGRKGDIVTKLSKETHTNIYCDSTSTTQSLWTTVSIIGDAVACQKAYQKIAAICDDEVDDCVAEIAIQQARHPLIIGAKGKTIRKLSADNNVRIFCPDSKDICNSLTIEGDFESVFKCYHAMMSIVNRERNMDVPNNKTESKDNGEVDSTMQSKLQGSSKGENVANPVEKIADSDVNRNEVAEDTQGDNREVKEKEKANTKVKGKEKKLKGKDKIENEKASAKSEDEKIEDQKVGKKAKKKKQGNSKNDDIPLNELKSQVEELMNEVSPSAPVVDSAVTATIAEDGVSPENVTVTAGSTNDTKRKDIDLKFKRNFTIPSSIVGLLLVAKSRQNPSVINQIQRATGTRIRKADPQEDSLTPDTPTETTAKDVPFTIQSNSEDSIEVALKAVNDIINGDRIMGVLKGLDALRRKKNLEAKKAASKASKAASAEESHEATIPATSTSDGAVAVAVAADGSLTTPTPPDEVAENSNKTPKGETNKKKIKDVKKKPKTTPTKKVAENNKGGNDEGGANDTGDNNTPSGDKLENGKKTDKREKNKKMSSGAKSPGTNKEVVNPTPSSSSSSSSTNATATQEVMNNTSSKTPSTTSSASATSAAQETAAPSPKPVATSPSASAPAKSGDVGKDVDVNSANATRTEGKDGDKECVVM